MIEVGSRTLLRPFRACPICGYLGSQGVPWADLLWPLRGEDQTAKHRNQRQAQDAFFHTLDPLVPGWPSCYPRLCRKIRPKSMLYQGNRVTRCHALPGNASLAGLRPLRGTGRRGASQTAFPRRAWERVSPPCSALRQSMPRDFLATVSPNPEFVSEPGRCVTSSASRSEHRRDRGSHRP